MPSAGAAATVGSVGAVGVTMLSTKGSALLTGVNAYESALLDLMERIVADFPALRLYSLPSMSDEGQRRYLELGVEGEPPLVDAAMESIRQEVERRGIRWQWRA